MKNILKCLVLLLLLLVFSLGAVIITAVAHQDNISILKQNETRPDYPKDSGPVWMVHLSDLHLSKHQDPSRTQDFANFCKFLSNVIKPSAVIVTGDITQSKDQKNIHLSRQFEIEWANYHKAVNESQILEHSVWMDLRGNHDVFDVYSDSSPENYFRAYGFTGAKHRSYLREIHVNGLKIAFLGLDFTPTPALRQPLNFMGYLSVQERHKIRKLIREASQTAHHVIYFGHYPLSFVKTEDGSDVRNMLDSRAWHGNGLYLCGHLHTLFRTVYKMHAFYPDLNLLELEIPDWKEERIFRLMVYYGGNLIFKEFVFYSSSSNTGVMHLQLDKKEVTCFVFSDSIVTEVRFATNLDPLLVKMSPGEEGSPNLYKGQVPVTGQNFKWYKVVVTLNTGNKFETILNIPGPGGSPKTTTFWNYFILFMNWEVLFQISFFFLAFGTVSVLVGFRIVHMLRLKFAANPKFRLSFQSNKLYLFFMKHFIRKLWVLSAMDAFFWPLVCTVLYLIFMPWCLAYVMEKKLALIFSWGVVTLNPLAFIPPNMNAFYGFFILLLYVATFIIALSYRVDHVFSLLMGLATFPPFGIKLLMHLPFVIIFLSQVRHCIIQGLTYGFLSFLSPFALGLNALSVYLYFKTFYLTLEDFRELKMIWA